MNQPAGDRLDLRPVVTAEVIRWRGQRARIGPWRGDRHVAQLTPVGGGGPSAEFLRRCLGRLEAQGFARVVTGAVGPLEATAFLAAGFDVADHLHLLRHDLTGVPARTGTVRTRRARRRDRSSVLAVDAAAFPGFWRLDDDALDEAIEATPVTRYRLVRNSGGSSGDSPSVVAYAVTGRSGRQGYLQRLAVAPSAQRSGLGRALAVDALLWLRRWRATSAVVNTQVDNAAAVALYESVGFRREAQGLCVLGLDLGP